jgi:formate-dependent phosphoribosylglycinamide formyltransferase (GAR transformylase)
VHRWSFCDADNTSSFAALVKKVAPHVIVSHIHALATKILPATLKEVLSTAIKFTDFTRRRSENRCILKHFVTKLEQNIKCFSTIQKFAGFQDNKS